MKKGLLFFLSLSFPLTGCDNLKTSINKVEDKPILQSKIDSGYFDDESKTRDYSSAIVILTYDESAKFKKITLDSFPTIELVWIHEQYSFSANIENKKEQLNDRRSLIVGFLDNSFSNFRQNIILFSEYSFVYDVTYINAGIAG